MPNQHITNVRAKSLEVELHEQLHFQITQPGGDPSLLLTLLAQIIETEAWKTQGQRSFVDYICRPFPEGLGWGIASIQTILQLQHTHESAVPELHDRLQSMRQAIDRLLTTPARKHGRPRKVDVQKDANVTFSDRAKGNSRYATLARLQRDRPDLAEKVLVGTMSAHEAAIEAGFRKKAVQVYPGDLDRTIGALQKHFDAKMLFLIAQKIVEDNGK